MIKRARREISGPEVIADVRLPTEISVSVDERSFLIRVHEERVFAEFFAKIIACAIAERCGLAVESISRHLMCP